MILLPYFIERHEHWIYVNVFLSSGGRHAWHIDLEKDKVILKMLKDNGFPVVKLEKTTNVYYAEIDKNNMDLNSFYNWNEVCPDTSDEDVWRTLTIPVSLWTCPIFKENFFINAKLPLGVETILNKV
jgi:hypothetical protein